MPTAFHAGERGRLGENMDDEGFNIASEQTQKRMDALFQLADKLATMATGALALTVTFRRDMSAPTNSMWVLKASWVAFIITVIGFLLVYWGRIALHKRLTREAIRSERPYVIASFPWYARIGQFLLIMSFLAGLGLLAFYGATQ